MANDWIFDRLSDKDKAIHIIKENLHKLDKIEQRRISYIIDKIKNQPNDSDIPYLVNHIKNYADNLLQKK